MKYILLVLLVIPAMCLFEVGWVLYLIALPFLIFWWIRPGLWMQAALTTLIVAVLIAHSAGYKIYGSPMVATNAPLAHPQPVVGFELPNVFVLESGERIPLSSYELKPEFANASPEEVAEVALSQFKDDVLQLDTSGDIVMVQYRIRYWCGNTFFPRPFPDMIPRYGAMPLEDYFRYRYFLFQPIDTDRENQKAHGH